MADPTALAALAQQLRDLVTTTLLDAGRPVGRSYISHGAPAWDACGEDQVTVHLAPLSFRSTGSGRQQQTRLDVGLVLQVVRCVPVPADDGTPPPAVDLDTSAVGLLDDAARVVYGVLAAEWIPACTGLTLGQMNPLGPLGGVAGWSWQVTAQLL